MAGKRRARPVAANRAAEPPWPVRGTPGGWRDHWDAPDTDTETLRLVAAAIRQHEADVLARVRADLAGSPHDD